MINIIFVSYLFLLGIIIGSFLNVVVLRFNTGKSVQGRSGCFSCGHQLSPRELVPVFSWLFQGGRCRHCSSKISRRYIKGELVTGFIFAGIAARSLFVGQDIVLSAPYLVATAFLLLMFSILIVVFFYDLDHKIIPDELSLTFAVLGFASMFFFSFEAGVFVYSAWGLPSLWNVLAGVLVPLPFALVWFFSKGRLIGLGDPKLMVGMGFLLGLAKGFSAVFVSFWVGAAFALAIFALNKIYSKKLLSSGKKSIMKTEIPFAPFLIIGTFVVLLFSLNLFN